MALPEKIVPGFSIGHLTVEGQSRLGGRVHVICTCGTRREFPAKQFLRGEFKSCGCKRWRPFSNHRAQTHGLSKTPEYQAWCSIKKRCLNPSNISWPDYGGRGITICDAWRDSFDVFFAYVGRRPSPNHSIDRINNDGNYEPGNVRWATRSEQQNNKRRTRFRYHPFQKLSFAIADEIRALVKAGAQQKDVAARYGVDRSRISHIMSGRAWSRV